MDPKGSGARIMIVDDDPDTVAVLSRHLKREGLVPIEACSGAECLRLLGGDPVDVILLDLMMPEMDGFEVCRKLRANPATAEIPVIMITARDDIEARSEGIRAGISEFLAKPFTRRQLLDRITAQLEMIAAARATDDALSRFAPGQRR